MFDLTTLHLGVVEPLQKFFPDCLKRGWNDIITITEFRKFPASVLRKAYYKLAFSKAPIERKVIRS